MSVGHVTWFHVIGVSYPAPANITAKHHHECLLLPIDLSPVHGHMEIPYQSIPRQFLIVAAFKINVGPIYLMHERMPPFVLRSLGH